MNLFSQESDTAYSPDLSSADKAKRYSENGLINRLYDSIQDNIRTQRDANGYKGPLLEKAGMVGDASEFSNYYYKEIEDYNDKIDTMKDKLADIEDRYYAKYSALETAISKMNSQSSF
jgi:flagellar hook-associated protein 2